MLLSGTRRCLLSGGSAAAAVDVDAAVVALADKLLWLDANAIVAADGSAVSTWSDRSGNLNDAVQATGGNQPLYQTNEQNARAGVESDGTDDFMAFTLISTIRTLYVVCKWVGSYIDYTPLLGDSRSGITPHFHGDTGDGLINTGFCHASVAGGTAWVNGVSTAIGDLVKPLATSLIVIKTSGNVEADWTAGQFGSPDRVWSGFQFEILACSTAHDDPTREAIEASLMAKWGIV